MKKTDKTIPTPDPVRNLLITQIFTSEALINILERKGIVTRQEILDEVRALKDKAEAQAAERQAMRKAE